MKDFSNTSGEPAILFEMLRQRRPCSTSNSEVVVSNPIIEYFCCLRAASSKKGITCGHAHLRLHMCLTESQRPSRFGKGREMWCLHVRVAVGFHLCSKVIHNNVQYILGALWGRRGRRSCILPSSARLLSGMYRLLYGRIARNQIALLVLAWKAVGTNHRLVPLKGCAANLLTASRTTFIGIVRGKITKELCASDREASIFHSREARWT